MTPENLLSEWSRLLVGSLCDAGIRDVVISPGSRSTPLAWAFLSCSRARCRSIVDERSAAFFALGHARVTGIPALVVCTSGSAAANYFPAIVEASLSRTPLIVLTADRPFELLDAAAAQTIDQTKMYGGYVRRFVDLGMPDPAETAMVALRRKAAQTVADSLAPEPGPVHLNFRARKPLEHVEAKSAAGKELAGFVDALLARDITKQSPVRRRPRDDSLAAVARDCSTAERGVIVCGPAPPHGGAPASAVARLASHCGFAVYAEATSQLRFGLAGDGEPPLVLDGLDVLLRAPSFRDRFAPDLILQIGEPPVSGAWDRFVGSHRDIPRHVVATHGWSDPHGTAKSLLVGDFDETLLGLVEAVEAGTPRRASAWLESLARENDESWRAVDGVLAADSGVSEGAAVRAVVEALPEGTLLSLGNSLPVRHTDSFVRRRELGISVVAQRGASGIDGLVSSASGAACAAGRPTVLVLGDVSALHDLGGFAAASSVEVPFVVVVLNNDGGRIFEQLPLANLDIGEDRLRFWTTPHGGHFGAVRDLFRVSYERPSTIDTIRSAVTLAVARPGCSLIEVVVPPHGAREQASDIAARLDTQLRALVAE